MKHLSLGVNSEERACEYAGMTRMALQALIVYIFQIP